MLLGNWIQIPKIWNRSLYVGQTSIPLFSLAFFSHQEHSLQVKSNNELSFMASRGPFMIPKAISGPIENLRKDRQSTCTQYRGRDRGGFFLIIGRSICKKLIHTHTHCTTILSLSLIIRWLKEKNKRESEITIFNTITPKDYWCLLFCHM